MSLAAAATFCAYLLLMLAVGAVGWRLTGSLRDYLLGGRRLGAVVTALSAGASDMSGWLLLGLPGAVYASGLGQGWMALGLLLGAWLNWRLVAGRLREQSEQLSAITLPAWLQRRFAIDGHGLRVLAALVILVFYAFYTAAGLVAGAKLFAASFGLPYAVALWCGGAVIIAYTFFGGFLAVAWTDAVQALLMLLALVVVPVLAVQALGGWPALLQAVGRTDPAALGVTAGLTPLGLVSLLAWGLGYFGQPHILVRFMAARSPQVLPRARRLAVGWMALGLCGALLTGLAGIAWFAGAPLADGEQVFMRLIAALAQPWLAGILLAAILAAIMSTVDSQLLVASSALAEDLYRPLLRPRAGERELLAVGRLAVAGIALVALGLAADPQRGVLGLVAHAWAGFGAAFGPVIVLALWWPGMTGAGACAGVATGAVTVLLWQPLSGGVFDLYAMVPGCVLGALAAVLVSRLRRTGATMGRASSARASNTGQPLGGQPEMDTRMPIR